MYAKQSETRKIKLSLQNSLIILGHESNGGNSLIFPEFSHLKKSVFNFPLTHGKTDLM